MLRTRITFTRLPVRIQSYYDWLLTGLSILQEQGKLELQWRDALIDRVLRQHPKVFPRLERHAPALAEHLSPTDYVCLTGKITCRDKSVTFAMDVADAPFTYCLALLETVDVYFKVQCPIQFQPEGFPLNSQVRVPYHPDVFAFRDKIRPAMLGRPLGNGTNFRKNLAVLRRWENAAAETKSVRMFACFGGDRAPEPREAHSPLPAPHNYQSESSLLARWGGRVHHPNFKRARVVEMLRDWNLGDVDARIWRSANPRVQGDLLSERQYMRALGRSVSNVNISGFRRSFPYRIIDTLMTGGMVATDEPAVRWYREFEPGLELMNIGPMGYEPEGDVDWTRVETGLRQVYEASAPSAARARSIYQLYRDKWAPPVFATYFVTQCLEALEQA